MELRPDIKVAGLVIGVAVIAVAFGARMTSRYPSAVPLDMEEGPPLLVGWQAPLPVAADRRETAPDVIATANVVRPPWNLGLRLRNTYIGRDWSEHRALIEHVPDGDLRTYAIGDLLPYASVLVGVSTGAIELTIADEELIYIDVKGRVRSVADFRTAYERRALRRAAEDQELTRSLAKVLELLRSDDPDIVQDAINALIAAGAPAVGTLVRHVESQDPISSASYIFSEGSDAQPRVYGDVIIGILQAITGQSFGDPMAPDQSDADRAWIRAQWSRWFGLPSTAAVEDRSDPPTSVER